MSEPTHDADRRRAITRRTYLAATTAVSLPALAGCTGGGGPDGGTTPDSDDGTTAGSDGEATDDSADGTSADDESEATTDEPADGESDESTADGSEGSAPAEGTAHLFEEDIPADPAFVANPDVSGPGGDAELLVPLGISSRGDEAGFETFVVHVEEVILEDGGGDAVTVPIDVELDLTDYEYGGMVRGDTITVGWLLEIPAATYTAVEFVFSPIEIVHESDGDVTDLFDPAGSHPIGDDGEGAEVEADVVFRPLPNFRVTYEPWDDRLVFGPESDGVGFHTMPSQYFDPSEYGA